MDEATPHTESHRGGPGDSPGSSAIVVHNPDELLAAMPHLLGFNRRSRSCWSRSPRDCRSHG
jgi:hypothetical protein